MPAAPQLRLARQEDLKDIVEIYNLAIRRRGSTSDLTPLTVQDRIPWFEAHDPKEHPVWVAEADGVVVGWCSISPYFPGRRGLMHTKEISFYVHEKWQRLGVGSAMVAHALDACAALGVWTIFAILLDQNHASEKLLEKMGFARWGHLPRVSLIDGEEFGHYYYGRRVVR